MTQLAHDVRAITRALNNGDHVSEKHVTDLASRAIAEASNLDQQSGQDLTHAVGELILAMQASLERTKEKLQNLGTARRAARGYGHLRAGHRGQRAIKQA